MQRLSYPNETVLSKKMTRKRTSVPILVQKFAPLNAPLKAPLNILVIVLLRKFSKELSKEHSKEQNFVTRIGTLLCFTHSSRFPSFLHLQAF